MKILFVTPQLPAPPTKGTTLRNFYLIRHAAQRHDVRVLSVQAGGDDLAQAERLLEVPVTAVPAQQRSNRERLISLFTDHEPDLAKRLRSFEMIRAYQQLVQDWVPDIIQFEALESAGAVDFSPQFDGPMVIYDAHNAEASLQGTLWRNDLADLKRLPSVAYSAVQERKLSAYEAGLARASSAVMAVSNADAAALRPSTDATITVVPNGVDTVRYQADSVAVQRAERPVVLFIGTLDYRPNVIAVTWLARRVMPKLARVFHGIRFAIVGRSPSPQVQALASSVTQVVGPVADDREWLARSWVCVAPLRSGGGMRFKIVQAMAAGVPVVSTPFGAEGTDALHEEHLLLADAPGAFAGAIARVLRRPQETADRVRRARELVTSRYDWGRILPAYDDLLYSLKRRVSV